MLLFIPVASPLRTTPLLHIDWLVSPTLTLVLPFCRYCSVAFRLFSYLLFRFSFKIPKPELLIHKHRTQTTARTLSKRARELWKETKQINPFFSVATFRCFCLFYASILQSHTTIIHSHTHTDALSHWNSMGRIKCFYSLNDEEKRHITSKGSDVTQK